MLNMEDNYISLLSTLWLIVISEIYQWHHKVDFALFPKPSIHLNVLQFLLT